MIEISLKLLMHDCHFCKRASEAERDSSLRDLWQFVQMQYEKNRQVPRIFITNVMCLAYERLLTCIVCRLQLHLLMYFNFFSYAVPFSSSSSIFNLNMKSV